MKKAICASSPSSSLVFTGLFLAFYTIAVLFPLSSGVQGGNVSVVLTHVRKLTLPGTNNTAAAFALS